jgi:AcrR family transcriptional regulator
VATRGEATRDKLIAATHQVVIDVGYPHATTKLIAEAAGVAEGTIYRHFPDKLALFYAAALAGSQSIVDEFEELPAKAGSSSVLNNLTEAMLKLASLREQVMPLELAILADPDLAERRRELAPQHLEDGPHPPLYLAAYLSEEQKLGRIRHDVDCVQAAMMLLASMFGLAMMPGAEGPGIGLVEPMVNLFLTGMAP